MGRPEASAGRPSICWIAWSEPARSTTTVAVLGAEPADVRVTSRRVPSSVCSITVWLDSNGQVHPRRARLLALHLARDGGVDLVAVAVGGADLGLEAEPHGVGRQPTTPERDAAASQRGEPCVGASADRTRAPSLLGSPRWTPSTPSGEIPPPPGCSSTSTARCRRSCRSPRTLGPCPGSARCCCTSPRSLGRVAVVSGRPVSYLAEHLPDGIELHGLYGLESRIDGVGPRTRADGGAGVRSSTRWSPRPCAALEPDRRRRRAQGPVAHPPLPPGARRRGRGRRWAPRRRRLARGCTCAPPRCRSSCTRR